MKKGCLIFSSPHHGVLTPEGLSERTVARNIASGITESLTERLEMVDLSGPPEDNWRGANRAAARFIADGLRIIVIETHINSSSNPLARGLLLEHHAGNHDEHQLCHCLANHLVPVIPPHRLVAVVQQPDENYPNWRFLRTVVWPAVLIETGFIQDPVFCKWLTRREHHLAIGHEIVSAVFEWLDMLEPPHTEQPVPVGGVIIG